VLCRYYASIGRFISPDTTGQDLTDAQTLNRYTYCSNNPLKFTDPSGHWSLKAQLMGSWEVIKGYGDAIKNTVKGVVQLAVNPVKAVTEIANAVTHPIETFNNVKEHYSSLAQTERGMGEIVGEVLITVATIGVGFATKAG